MNNEIVTTEALAENTLLKNREIVPLSRMDKGVAWESAIDAVDYPVFITNAYYQKDGEFVNANGRTSSGRDKHFNLVVVDKLRDGNLQAITAVTGMYGTIKTADVYVDFRTQLNEMGKKYNLRDLFVTSNGGRQELLLEFEGMSGVNNVPDEITMRVRLNTSVDGSSLHSLTMIAYNKTGDVSHNVYGGDYKLAARHTNTLNERSVNFAPSILKIIEEWNTTIMPTMELMFNKKFNRDVALDLVEKIAGDAGMGERHREKIRSLYQSGSIRTNDKTDSLYRINSVIGQYIEDEMEFQRDLQERFRSSVAKTIKKHLK